MTKRERMFYGLGRMVESETWKTVELEQLFGDECFKGYELGEHMGNVTIFDTNAPKVDGVRRRIVMISKEFAIDQIVNILLEALSYEMKNKKNE